MDDSENSGYSNYIAETAQKAMQRAMEGTGIPTCYICGKPIIGAHIDYIDKDRNPRKICIGCCYLAIDYYLNAREKQLKGKAISH